LKLKISPQFLLNQSYKIVLILSLGLIIPKVYSNEKITTEPGIFESIEKLQSLIQEQYKILKSSVSTTPILISDLKRIEDVKLDPIFIKAILFQSDDKFLSLIQNDECRFYSLLQNNLLKVADGDLSTFIINYKDPRDKVQKASMPRDDFFKALYEKKCLSLKEYQILFDDANIAKTIKGIKFTNPSTEKDCKIIHQEWLANSYTPYLCRINQLIKDAKKIQGENLSNKEIILKKEANFYLSNISIRERTYIDNLCSNLTIAQNFCANYLKPDIWNKVINSEAPNFKLNYKCASYLGHELPISANDQKACAAKFNSDKSICISKGNENFPSYFPMPNCDDISDALNNSKLIADYHDCPGNLENEAITNIHRIINHFSPRKINSNFENCSGEAQYSLARLNLDIKHDIGWPLKVCFLNRVEKKENCIPYIPGTREDEPLSEDKIIAKILYIHKGAPAKLKCKIVNTKKYNPVRSEFKEGCFIVTDFESCSSLECKKRVIWEEKEQTDIHFIGTPTFEYFTSAFSNERYSIQNLFSEVKKIENRSIKNINDLIFHLDKNPSNIVHGVGCSEDLLPDTYLRKSLNQCHPLPFLITGHLIKNGETFLVAITAIDDLFSPRLIEWQKIFNSISTYKELHPLNSWTLYGLKK
jgi:hypothetical protein